MDEGISAEGVEVDAVLGGLGDVGAGGHGGKGPAVADAFGHGDHVGGDAPVFEAPEVVAGATEAGLDFVGDADAAVFADDVI